MKLCVPRLRTGNRPDRRISDEDGPPADQPRPRSTPPHPAVRVTVPRGPRRRNTGGTDQPAGGWCAAGRGLRRRAAAAPSSRAAATGDAGLRLRAPAEPARQRDLDLLRRAAPRQLRQARPVGRAHLGAVHLPAVHRPAADRRGVPAPTDAAHRVSAAIDNRGLLAATEPARAAASAGAFVATLPLLAFAPRGDRHPVLVLPGLGASDVSTGTLRRWLRT